VAGPTSLCPRLQLQRSRIPRHHPLTAFFFLFPPPISGKVLRVWLATPELSVSMIGPPNHGHIPIQAQPAPEPVFSPTGDADVLSFISPHKSHPSALTCHQSAFIIANRTISAAPMFRKHVQIINRHTRYPRNYPNSAHISSSSRSLAPCTARGISDTGSLGRWPLCASNNTALR
jgi:hypothetical protein